MSRHTERVGIPELTAPSRLRRDEGRLTTGLHHRRRSHQCGAASASALGIAGGAFNASSFSPPRDFSLPGLVLVRPHSFSPFPWFQYSPRLISTSPCFNLPTVSVRLPGFSPSRFESAPGFIPSALWFQSAHWCQSISVLVSLRPLVSVRPLSVSILGSAQTSLELGKSYELVCHTAGSRPPANVTWWVDQRRLTGDTVMVSGERD